MLPDEATDASEALRLADERLYAQKYSHRGETDRTMHAFLDALSEREPGLQVHAESVATLAVETGRMLDLRRDELDELSRAAQLHDSASWPCRTRSCASRVRSTSGNGTSSVNTRS